MWGVDPDLRLLGWSRVQVSFTKPATAPVTIEQVWLGLWAPPVSHRNDIDQANAMIGSLANPVAPWLQPEGGVAEYAVAEAQRIYPKRNEAPATVVAKANDLLRLAQISGAFQSHLAHAGEPRARSYLPHVWKGQADKDAMHKRVLKQLELTPVVLWHNLETQAHYTIGAAMAGLAKAKRMDALDALCLAQYGIDEIVHGRWQV